MWKILKTTELFKHPRLTLLEDDIELPNGKKSKYLKFYKKADGSDIVAIDKNGKILLIKEYNHPVGKELWQFPGGFSEENEKPEETADRELGEEAGFKAKKYKHIGFQYLYRRRISEVSHVFVATDLYEVPFNREESENDMQLKWFTEEEIDKMVFEDEINACDTLAIWMLYKSKKNF